jgi:hypothetical protein
MSCVTHTNFYWNLWLGKNIVCGHACYTAKCCIMLIAGILYALSKTSQSLFKCPMNILWWCVLFILVCFENPIMFYATQVCHSQNLNQYCKRLNSRIAGRLILYLPLHYIHPTLLKVNRNVITHTTWNAMGESIWIIIASVFVHTL